MFLFTLIMPILFSLTTTYLMITNSFNPIVSIILVVLSFIIGLAVAMGFVCLSFKLRGEKYVKNIDAKDPKRRAYMYQIAKIIVFWLRINIKTHNLELLDPNKTYVFYSNHQCFIDSFILDYVFKGYNQAYLYKNDLDSKTFMSNMAKGIGCYSLARNNPKHDLKVILQTIKDVKSGINFLIFPEGTRAKDGVMHEFKAGAFKVAQKSGVDAVIICLNNAYKIPKRMFFGFNKIDCTVVDVLSNDEIKDLQTVDVANLAKAKIQENLDFYNK